MQPLLTPGRYYRVIDFIFIEINEELLKYMNIILNQSGPLRIITLLDVSESESASDSILKSESPKYWNFAPVAIFQVCFSLSRYIPPVIEI